MFELIYPVMYHIRKFVNWKAMNIIIPANFLLQISINLLIYYYNINYCLNLIFSSSSFRER